MKKKPIQNKSTYTLLTTKTAESNLCSSLEGVNCHIYKQNNNLYDTPNDSLINK